MLFIAAIAIDLTLTSLAGQSLVKYPAISTLPFALITVGGAVTIPVAGRIMQRYGRKSAFLLGSAAGVVGGSVSAISLLRGSFIGLCCGAALVGGYQAVSQFYRLAAADGVDVELRPKVVSLVLAGGLIAAFGGPSLAVWARGMLSGSAFAGAYVLVAILAGMSFLILIIGYFPLDRIDAVEGVSRAEHSFDLTSLRYPDYFTATTNSVAAGVAMMLVMTAAPIAITNVGYSIRSGAEIMQWHLVGMYAPSLFSGVLVKRFGIPLVLCAGLCLMFISLIFSISSISLFAFYGALFCLGIGWNLSFVASSTLLTTSRLIDERLKAQATSETLRYVATSAASLAAGILCHLAGWVILNLIVVPILVITGGVTAWWALSNTSDGRARRLLRY